MKFNHYKNKLKLYGYNNLTKTLSFNLYDICYIHSQKDLKDYQRMIEQHYHSKKLTEVLISIAEIIGAKVLNIATEDYDPSGASVTMLVSECSEIKTGNSVLHLDKSHITVHTYPENHPTDGIYTVRADVDISTCGEISPLNSLNILFSHFKTDLAIIDYRVRGFARISDGSKIFTDHSLESFFDFLTPLLRDQYEGNEVFFKQFQWFHGKFKRKEILLKESVFLAESLENDSLKSNIISRINQEMDEILKG